MKTQNAFLLCLALASAGCGGTPSASSKDETPAALRAAEDFLTIAGPDPASEKAALLTTASFKKELKELPHVWYEFKTWSIDSQSLNSSQTKATFRGKVQATKKYDGKAGAYLSSDFSDSVGFVIRLAKENDHWLVEHIEFGAAQAEKDRKVEK